MAKLARKKRSADRTGAEGSLRGRIGAAWAGTRKGTIVAAGLVAATATFLLNLDKIADLYEKRVAPALAEKVDVVITFDAPADRSIILGVNPKGDQRSMESVHTIAGGQAQRLTLTATARHKLFWQGNYFVPAAGEIMVGDSPMRWRLQVAGRNGDQEVLALMMADTRQSARPANVSAGAMLAAGGTRDSDFRTRAIGMIGLYTVGSIDCAESLKVTRFMISYGCFALGAGRDLGDILAGVDRSDPGLIARTMGPREPELRALGSPAAGAAPVPADADFERRLKALTETPAFQRGYGDFVDRYYLAAERLAAQLGLTSRRGRLFMFERVTNVGAASVGRLASRALAEPDYRALSQEQKILRLAELSKAALPRMLPDPIRRTLGRRIDLFATGRGQVGEVTYDFDALGFTLS